VAVPHDCNPLPERHCLDLIVRHVDRRDAELLVELRKGGAHADPELRIEVRERLVHEERLRLAHDRAPHRDPLALATRQLGGLALEEIREPEELRDLVHPRADLGFRHAPHLQSVAEVLAHAHVRIERVALEDHRDVSVPRRQVGNVAPADLDLPCRDLLEAGDRAEQRRLSAPGWADERDELAVRNVERDVVDRHDVPREDLGDVPKCDLGHGCRVWIPHFPPTGIDHPRRAT